MATGSRILADIRVSPANDRFGHVIHRFFWGPVGTRTDDGFSVRRRDQQQEISAGKADARGFCGRFFLAALPGLSVGKPAGFNPDITRISGDLLVYPGLVFFIIILLVSLLLFYGKRRGYKG